MNEKTKKLNQSVGSEANNNDGQLLGNITGMIRDSDGDVLEYIVLKSHEFFGRGDRFFAIPAQSPIVRLGSDGHITIDLTRDELQFARGISAGSCPKPNPNYGLSIYELYDYGQD